MCGLTIIINKISSVFGSKRFEWTFRSAGRNIPIDYFFRSLAVAGCRGQLGHRHHRN